MVLSGVQAVLQKNMNATIKNLTDYIDTKVEKTVADKTQYLASREDLANTKTDMIKWFVGLFFAIAMMVIGLYFKA